MAARYFHQKPTPAKPWYRRGNGARIAADTTLVAEHFPTLGFRIDEKERKASLEGPLVFLSECGISTAIETRLLFPLSYPELEPVAFDSAQRFKPFPGKKIVDRHIYPDGQCCLWLPPRSPWKSSDPAALRDFLEQLVVFFDRQLIYDDSGVWPGPAYDHGDAGYKQFIQEELHDDRVLSDALSPVILGSVAAGRNQSCPCGSGRKFKKCHLRVVEEIRWRIRRG